MVYSNPDSEQALENATMALFAQLGWQTANCFEEVIGPQGTLGRETTNQVVLMPRLHAALHKLNPDLPAEALDLAIEELTRDRNAMSAVYANREINQSPAQTSQGSESIHTIVQIGLKAITALVGGERSPSTRGRRG